MSAADWATKPLGGLFDVGAGKTMSAVARSGEDKVPFLRTSNVFWDEIDLSDVDEMSIPERELTEKLVEPGDLLVCEGGEIGRAAIWEASPTPMSFQNHLHRLRRKADDVDPRFYVYFFQSAFTQLGIFEGAGNKTTIPNLSSGRLKALDVPHPPLDEQVAIADSLRQIQRARRLNDRLIATAEELKAAAMQQLFSRGLRGEAQEATEIGPIPENWTVTDLGSLGKVGNGTTPNRKNPTYWVGGTVPWVTSGRIYERQITGSDEAVTARAIRDANLPTLRPGAVLMAIVGQGKTLGHCALLEVEATVSRHVGYIQPDSSIVHSGYLRGFLESQYLYLRQLASGFGSTRGALTGATLRGLRVPLPPTIAEQQEIVDVLDVLDRKIDLHRHKRDVLDELFKSLLYKLMTGEISIEDLDLSALPGIERSAA